MRKVKYILGLILTFIISFSIGFIYNNYYKIVNKNSEINLELINLENIVEDNNNYYLKDNTGKFEFKLNGCHYVDKINFNYETKSNFSWRLDYLTENAYNLREYAAIEDSSSASVNVFSEHIGQSICDFIITVNTKDEINISNININNNIYYITPRILTVLIMGLSLYNLFYFRKKLVSKIEYMYLYIALIIGLSMIFLLPFGLAKSWDDEYHFKASYNVVNKYYSEGALELLSPNNRWERFNTYEENNEYINYINKLDLKTSSTITDYHYSLKSVSHIGSSFGFLIAKLFNLNLYHSINISLIFNLVLYIILIFISIKISPIGKKVIFCIGLLPTSMFMASNFTYDTTITGCIILATSIFLNSYFSKTKVKKKNVLIFNLLVFIASISKPIYSPISLIWLLIKKEKYETKKYKIIADLLSIIVAIMLMLTFIIPTASGSFVADSRGGNTNVNLQLNGFIKHPISSIKIYNNNMLEDFSNKLLGPETLSCNIWMKIRYISNVYYIYLILLIFTVVISSDNSKKELNFKSKIFLTILCLFIIALIWGSMYLSYTEVGKTVISGVQGRYFIPLLFPISIIFSTNKIQYKIDDKKIIFIMGIIIFILLFLSLYRCCIV